GADVTTHLEHALRPQVIEQGQPELASAFVRREVAVDVGVAEVAGPQRLEPRRLAGLGPGGAHASLSTAPAADRDPAIASWASRRRDRRRAAAGRTRAPGREARAVCAIPRSRRPAWRARRGRSSNG